MNIPATARLLALWCLALTLTLGAPRANAEGNLRIKLATIAPRGSLYHRVIQEMGEAYRVAAGPGASFTIYTDGSQGSESDLVRRMRIGQLNAAVITVIGLSEIDESVNALQKIPMLFQSSEEIEYAGQAMRPQIEQKFLEKGFVTLLWAEAGWVRFFSKQPAAVPNDLKMRRVFAWAGDEPQVQLEKQQGFRPVVLETADIVPGLQTGLIDTVGVTPMWALAGQIDRMAPFMIDVKWAPIVGALVINRSTWEGLPAAARDALRASAVHATEQLRAYQVKSDAEAITAMSQRGLTVVSPNAEQLRVWQQFAESAYPLIRGRMVSPTTFDEASRLVKEYRHLHPSR
jgi:TRAP-type C4-dicarboxylate transport system substrate-binding protein